MDAKDNKIILSHQELSEYFYGQLTEVNRKSICPLPEEFILYSSRVMQKYAFAENYLTENNQEKILGLNLLQAEQKSLSERKEIYTDIGDMILFQLGIFPEQINKKSPSKNYYLNIGRSAYTKAASLDCTFYDIPNFYNMLATSLENLIKVLTHVTENFSYDSLEHYLLDNPDAVENFSFQKKKLAN